jgi:hypothetical protein
MSFWNSPTNQPITGSEKDAFIPDFTLIPEGTMAIGVIKSCTVENKEATQYSEANKFIQVVYKLADGEFKNREVTQKIKVFDGKPEAIHRSLNMLKLLMMLCNYQPTHSNEPTNQDLANLHGKVIGLKIGEWSMPRADGSIGEGNFIREIHTPAGFKCETGVKAEVTHSRSSVDSAFSRNSTVKDDLDTDLPF